ncbi:protein FD [Nicotiana sylvestris]|uniref:FDb n=1 Tax=Nicotiana sylvestris TaxID=4096 RepID=A0A1U7YFI0_NICSY|nr:PREDICTED: protein FD-like [Nicotiana sylvestris]AVG70954.1 FDb [Nicotiana sylvestris]
MWSSTSSRGISSSSSKSSSSTSSSSSRSPFSPLNHHLNPRLKTMEEVWKDINLSSLQEHTTTYSRDHDHHHQTANFNGMILQDFLARPFATDPPPPQAASPVPATTMLNLNSVPELHFFGQNSMLHPPTPISQVPFEGLASSAANGRKRIPEIENNSVGDRRNKRMIKNRESAARSRARKQAYMNELELEVAHLLEENARLKKQQQQLRLESAAQVPKKKSLYRTSTAPF